ncbi:MAG: hypothetical protein PHF25_08435 [Candidatus Margulisbacteria bacterium]|nr:hypothetical protein [Candidatus Margulisiibacteriota bacterium]
MVDISGVPLRRLDSISKKKTEGSSVNSSINLEDGIFPVLALNEKEGRDEQEGKNKQDELGQFLRGIKDPSENEIAIEDI